MKKVLVCFLIITVLALQSFGYLEETDNLFRILKVFSVTVSDVAPFHDADYNAYNSYASDNGLKGDTIRLFGNITKFDEASNGYQFFILEQEDKYQWLVGVGYPTHEISHLLNKQVEVFCVYGGFSDAYNLPAVHIDDHGCVCDIESGLSYFTIDAKRSMENDGFIIQTTDDTTLSEEVSMKQYSVFDVTYTIPSTWITKEEENGYFHFGKEYGNPEGGYLYVKGNETDSSIKTNFSKENVDAFFKGYFNQLFISEEDIPYYSEGQKGYWIAYYSGGIKNGYYANCCCIINADYICGFLYTNTGVGRTDQDNEFLEIMSSFVLANKTGIQESDSQPQSSDNKNESENVPTDSNSSILFRNIPWFEEEETVRNILKSSEGLKTNEVKENTRITSWFRETVNMFPEFYVENAGVTLEYYGVSVAGYQAKLKLSFAYPIESERINYNTDSAQFYMAEYLIKGLEDTHSAYEDLIKKLTRLYGTPQEKSYYDSSGFGPYPEGFIWVAPDDSLVWLAADFGYDYTESKYQEIDIIYAAPNTTDYLKKLDAQIKKEISDNEAIQREQNSDNYEGL